MDSKCSHIADDIKKAGLAIYPDDGKRDELNLRYTKQMRPAF